MIKKHEVSSIAVGFPRTVLVGSFSEAVSIIKDCQEMEHALKNLKVGEADEFDVTDLLEDYFTLDRENLESFKRCNTSCKIEVNKYLNRVFTDLEVLRKRLDAAIKAMCCIDVEEIDSLLKSLYKVISGFLYFILIEFDIFDYVDANGDVNTTGDVDEIVMSYCNRENKKIDDLVSYLYSLSKDYVPKLDIFDSYPELEEQFQSVMGPNCACIDEKYLTLKMIKDVIDGITTPEDLIQMLVELGLEEDQSVL